MCLHSGGACGGRCAAAGCAGAGEAPASPPAPAEVAQRLRAIVRAMNRVSAADLALAMADVEARDALAELAHSFGFARLKGAVWEIRLADLHFEGERP